VTVPRYSPVGASLAFATLLLGSMFLLASLAPSFAAPAAAAKPVKEKVAAVAASETDGPSATGSIRAEDGGAGCQRARRKLWVDGEGWIVRRVTVC
jgi:hypothetical protein